MGIKLFGRWKKAETYVRYCRRCEEYYRTTAQHGTVCDKCYRGHRR